MKNTKHCLGNSGRFRPDRDRDRALENNLNFVLYHYDPQVLYKIKKIIGFGKIKPYLFQSTLLRKQTFFKYTIFDKKGITRLLCLLKDQLVFNRCQKDYLNLIVYYNSIFNYVSCFSLNKNEIKNEQLFDSNIFK